MITFLLELKARPAISPETLARVEVLESENQKLKLKIATQKKDIENDKIQMQQVLQENVLLYLILLG
jgi:hypothetical protein